MTTVLGIVGCSDKKYDPENWGKAHPDYDEGDEVDTLPLQYLYKSGYSTVKNRYGKTVPGDYRILSAGVGLADPNKPMEDSYDRTLHNMTDEEIQEWVDEVEPTLREWIDSNAKGDDVVVHTILGSDYLAAIKPILEDLPVEVVNIFEGTGGNGEQMQLMNWLVDQYRETGEADVEEGRETLGI
ncbi:DUF6884 domain-containing protein [Halorhabdus rudnickae]|uniref:DUF6884 domain-containing protein n=1 Tax=Halorhabdus rudnickae TaxID=1775544 RepID=UPI001082B1F9|nr:DUF6884 domain-containing protein [Halorhabdus rudnickae]